MLDGVDGIYTQRMRVEALLVQSSCTVKMVSFILIATLVVAATGEFIQLYTL